MVMAYATGGESGREVMAAWLITCWLWYQECHGDLRGSSRDSMQYLEPITGTLPSVSPLEWTNTKTKSCQHSKKSMHVMQIYDWLLLIYIYTYTCKSRFWGLLLWVSCILVGWKRQWTGMTWTESHLNRKK